MNGARCYRTVLPLSRLVPCGCGGVAVVRLLRHTDLLGRVGNRLFFPPLDLNARSLVMLELPVDKVLHALCPLENPRFFAGAPHPGPHRAVQHVVYPQPASQPLCPSNKGGTDLSAVRLPLYYPTRHNC